MQTSLDGYVSTGPDDDQSWVTWDIESLKPFVFELFDSVDTILIGRKLAIDYIPYWQDTFTKPDDAMHEFAVRIVGAKKIVFTKTLEKSVWDNTELAKGELREEVMMLKEQNGKDIVVYGGSSFVAALVKERLIDEFQFYINPVVLGKGVSIFGSLEERQKLILKKHVAFQSGIVMLTYGTVNK